MLVLLHYDALNNPSPTSSISSNRQKDFSGYLHAHPYQEFSDDELAKVRVHRVLVHDRLVFFSGPSIAGHGNESREEKHGSWRDQC